MITLDVEQGSEQWHAYRVGIPTASDFDKIVQINGKPSKQREKYLYQLAGERIIGKKEETFQSSAMERGIIMEEEAREYYSFIKDVEVKKVGFCREDKGFIAGASPDGLVGDDGQIEIKCPLLHTHVGYLLDNGLPSQYFQQVQGQLLITGRDWCDFISYYPSMRPLIVRVFPVKVFLKSLADELKRFCDDLDDVVRKLNGKL